MPWVIQHQRDQPGSGSGPVVHDINIYMNISSQTDGVATTFTVPEIFENLRVYYNGVFENDRIVSTSGTTFTLDFIPASQKILEIIYDRP